MDTNQYIWYALQSKVSNALQNWNLHRPYTARLDHRIPGFTEEWETLPDSDQPTAEEDATVSKLRSAQYPDPPKCCVRLFQYRPAWLEQLVLRVAGVEHVVFNSPFAVTEATGPLPYLQDFNGEGSKDANPLCPAMIGREQAKVRSTSENAILEYLKSHRNIDLDSVLVTDDQVQQSALYAAILRDSLAPSLFSLRYHADPVAWNQVYRHQCIRATSGSSNIWSNKPILAMWQAWSEKIRAVSSLPPSIRSQPKESILATARQTYAIFERHIQYQQSSSKNYLLGTEKPTMVDCLLWDHLMQAMADIHLVVVLADFPGLLKFSQHIWDTYAFGSAIDGTFPGSSCSSTLVWNLEENVCNAFAEIPFIPTRRKSDDYDSALDQMEKIAVPYLDLRKVLVLVKNRRAESLQWVHRHQSFATWHSWRMGDGFFPHKKLASKNKAIPNTVHTSAEDQVRRQYQRNDEIWMASVSAATILAMLSFGLAGFTG
jgi:hypothetical protein